MRLNGGFEYIYAQRTIGIRGNFLSFGVYRSRHVVDKRYYVTQKFHHSSHAHVFAGAYTEKRIYGIVNQTLADAHAEFVFGEMIFFKEFLHERLVVFCCGFNQSTVEFHSSRHFFFWNFFNCRSSAFWPP